MRQHIFPNPLKIGIILFHALRANTMPLGIKKFPAALAVLQTQKGPLLTFGSVPWKDNFFALTLGLCTTGIHVCIFIRLR